MPSKFQIQIMYLECLAFQKFMIIIACCASYPFFCLLLVIQFYIFLRSSTIIEHYTDPDLALISKIRANEPLDSGLASC